MKTIGLIGAGHIGSQVARLAVRSGYDVVISNSRGPETLADLVAELGPKARAATPEEAAKVAKQSLAERKTIRQVVIERGYVAAGKLTEAQLDEALDVLSMTNSQ